MNRRWLGRECSHIVGSFFHQGQEHPEVTLSNSIIDQLFHYREILNFLLSQTPKLLPGFLLTPCAPDNQVKLSLSFIITNEAILIWKWWVNVESPQRLSTQADPTGGLPGGPAPVSAHVCPRARTHTPTHPRVHTREHA